MSNAAIRHKYLTVGDLTIHYAASGDPAAPMMLMLHGFPEYWAAWAELLPVFGAHFHAIAPDQRGYNLTDKPSGIDAYQTKHLIADMAGLIDRLSSDRPITLVGHDWGASVAYGLAIRHPSRVERLVIINGVHPGPFQEALLRDPDQIAASQYFHYLRDPKAEERLSADDYDKMFDLFSHFSDMDWMTADQRQGYHEAWSRPGALTAMLNWYRATPIEVPQKGDTRPDQANPLGDTDNLRITMPHLLIFGTRDPALRPASIAGLDAYCDDLRIRRIDDADHWIIHQKPELIIREILHFCRIED